MDMEAAPLIGELKTELSWK